MFGKIKQELKNQIDIVKNYKSTLEKETSVLKERSEEFANLNSSLEMKTADLNEKINELGRMVTSSKIRDVLRTLEHNKLKPDRIMVNEQEMKLIESNKDVIKADKNGRMIFGVRIVLVNKLRPFVISVKKEVKSRSRKR